MKGLTLLEVLVSISITAIILAAVYGAYTSNTETIQLARENSQVYQTARIILDRMVQDLECAMIEGPEENPFIVLGMIGESDERDGRPADRIDLTTLTHLARSAGGIQTDLCEVGYSLEENPDGKGLVLYRRDAPMVDEKLGEGGTRQELSDLVRELDITYEDAQGGIHEAWNSLEGDQKGRLPALIRIRLVLEGAQGREHVFSTSVHPQVAGMEEK